MGTLEIFAVRIKQLRESLKMTQTEFSDYIGIKQQTLSGYERGIMKPPLDIAKGIAEKCNVSIDWLCGLSEKMNNSDEVETYGDVIRLLIKLNQKIYIELSAESDSKSFNIFQASINIGDSTIQSFIIEWKKIKRLHDDGTIDDDLYNLWVEKTVEKYNSHTLPSSDALPFDTDPPDEPPKD